MSWTFHQLKKEIAFCKGLVGAWWLYLLVLGVVFGADRGLISVVLREASETGLFAFLPFITLCALTFLVAFVVQQDPVVGTRAFWLTLPLSRGAMLTAKALFILIGFGLPALLVGRYISGSNPWIGGQWADFGNPFYLGTFILLSMAVVSPVASSSSSMTAMVSTTLLPSIGVTTRRG